MSNRAVGVSVGVVTIAALIWLARSPTSVAPTADEPFVLDSEFNVQGVTASEPESETAEVTAALTEAQAEIERLRTELAAAEASQEEDGYQELLKPTGYSGAARVLPSDARSVFDAELIDSSWAPAAESQLYENLVNKISDGSLQVNIVDVRCKTDACRVQMSYPRQPTKPSELAEISQPSVELSRQMISETDSVLSSGLLYVRGMFPGEPITSELYLFRTGTDGIVFSVESPDGISILDVVGKNPADRSEF